MRWLALFLVIFSGLLSAADVEYRVRPGESLWRICERFAQDPQLCWQQLAQRNGVASPRLIAPGAVLKIPVEWLKSKPTAARITGLQGEVTLYRKNGDELTPDIQTEVHLGDALGTGQGSVRVVFADESSLVIKPDSLLVFDRYSRFRESGMVDTSLRLERGSIRTYVKPRAGERQNFRIVTPSAVAAVRGTRFDVRVDAEGSMRNEVLGGTVAVSAAGVEKTVPAGFATLANQGEAPHEPVALLDAPEVEASVDASQVNVEWLPVGEAAGYWLELYRMPDDVPVTQLHTTEQRWQESLPAGDYRLVVRAIDELAIRGRETGQLLHVEDRPLPQPQPEPEQTPWDLWLFLGTAGLVLAL